MKARANGRKLRTGLFSMLAVGGMLVGADATLADQASGDVCMGTLFFNATGQKLNCTANDVTIARAIEVSPTECEGGSTIDLQATFQIVLSGGGSKQSRYDLGLYFDTLGDADHDGARGGTCTLTVIEAPDIQGGGSLVPPNPKAGQTAFIDLDENVSGQKDDFCGDINTANNNLYPIITLYNVLCNDSDGDGFLNLPNCTSWRQPGANEFCNDVTDAYPGTSSKCNCDDTFNVPVTVKPAKASLKKNATQALVTYQVKVTNEGGHPANLTALNDDTYGDVTSVHDPNSDSTCGVPPGCITATTCAVPQNNLAVSAEYTCEFTVLVPQPGSSVAVTDIVTGTVVDTVNGTTDLPTGSATVTIDLPQTP